MTDRSMTPYFTITYVILDVNHDIVGLGITAPCTCQLDTSVTGKQARALSCLNGNSCIRQVHSLRHVHSLSNKTDRLIYIRSSFP